MPNISYLGKDKNGKDTWNVRVFIGFDHRGKRKNHNKVIHGGKRDAEKYARKVESERDKDTFVEPSKLTFHQYMTDWLEQHAKKKVEPRTYEDYRDMIARHVYPLIGGMKMSTLAKQPLELRKVINMAEDGPGGKNRTRTAQYIHMVLKQAFKDAVNWGTIARNPMELIPRPKDTRKREIHPLSIEEVQRFLESAQYNQYYPFYALMIDTGVRPSEALALQWKYVDLKEQRIHIRHSLSRDRELGPPKNKSSYRTIPLTDGVTEMLRNYKREQTEEWLRKGKPDRGEYDFVFVTDNWKPLDLHNFRARHFKPLVKHACLPGTVVPYDLRHTCATLLLLAGINPKIVSERLGHSSIRMTLDTYSHVIPAMQETAAAKMNSMLFGSS